MAKIFVVEDNQGLSEAITSYLSVEGHNVVLFERINGLVEAAVMAVPDLIVLDVMLPDGNGFSAARAIKEKVDIPIMFLTARSSESDRITGFELGADDYVVKPFSMRELVLRVRSLLSRTHTKNIEKDDVVYTYSLKDEEGRMHTLSLDESSHTCTQNGTEKKLTATEWKILEYLSSHHHVLISREQILGQCLDYLADGSQRSINTHIKNIRAKLDQLNWIETVRGFGYRFIGNKEE
ncbi:MAG: response regulator transcription factor [Spirochaetia bacterium]|nr:response regulator transcription factor [Spirochaetia bacterium]